MSKSRDTKSKGSGRRYDDDFKREAVNLVVVQRYSIQAAADAVGVSSGSLRIWHAKFAPPPEACGEDATFKETPGREQTTAQAASYGGIGASDIKKGNGVFCEGVAVKHAWIQEHRDQFPVTVMCRVLRVSTRGLSHPVLVTLSVLRLAL